MRTSRITHIIALICFLPTVAGCTKTRTVKVSTDPVASTTRFSEGEEPTRITGYLAKGSDHRNLDGHVSFVPPDSLHFEPLDNGPRPKPATFGGSPAAPEEDPVPFTLPVDAVTSIDVVEADYSKAILLGVLGAVVFVIAGAAAVAISEAHGWD